MYRALCAPAGSGAAHVFLPCSHSDSLPAGPGWGRGRIQCCGLGLRLSFSGGEPLTTSGPVLPLAALVDARRSSAHQRVGREGSMAGVFPHSHSLWSGLWHQESGALS